MIYTITFNPAVDVVIGVDSLQLGGINRTTSQEIYYGGKGVNVSNVLRNLGRESTAWGFLAGTIGHAMQQSLIDSGLNCDFVMLPEGETRINTKMRSFVGDGPITETALNAGGPTIDDASLAKPFEQLDHTVEGDIVIVSGGAPAGVAKDTYARILQALAGKDVRTVVDATGSLLMNTLPYGPFLIKPNDEELAEIVDCDPDDYDRLVHAALDLHEKGAVNVLVSRGGKGAFLVDEFGKLHDMAPFAGTLVNSVGAGDSTVAGFVHGYLEGKEQNLSPDDVYERAFTMSQACGAATAFSPGLAARETVEELLARLR
ncbi:MAG: 1-phosphofructokinase family hexose kinase [Eggerthellaceae bacterium]|nr:1-phosphofructokinase family hexose kinase [Eggerthellaceae bacterium]